ncbi:MAG: hypothetical protein AB8U16_04640 [Rickettsiales endosymbiont of Dermacentor nuttalli]
MDLPYRPLNKNHETRIFEDIIHDLIEDKCQDTHNVQFYKKNNQTL